MKRKVYLHGSLATLYNQNEFEIDANTPREVISYFEIMFGGFHKAIADMYLHFVLGDPEEQVSLGEEDLRSPGLSLSCDEVHLIPATEGAKNGGGFLKVILGAILVGVAIFASGGTLAGLAAPIFGNALGISALNVGLLGLGMVAAGFAMAMSNYKEREKPQERPSGIYQGPLNTQTVGQAVPLIYGRNVIAGGVVIHASIEVDATPILYYPPGVTNPPPGS